MKFAYKLKKIYNLISNIIRIKSCNGNYSPSQIYVKIFHTQKRVINRAFYDSTNNAIIYYGLQCYRKLIYNPFLFTSNTIPSMLKGAL